MRPAQPTLQPTQPSSPTSGPEDLGTASVVALVEGPSDAVAVQTLAARQGRDLGAEGVLVVAIGGATNIGHHLQRLTGSHPGLRVAGLCDADEERAYRRAIAATGTAAATRVQMEALGFYVCEVDLEDELIRSLGAEAVLDVFDRAGTLAKFHLYQRQPAHREEALNHQLRGFVTNGKIHYARLFIAALDLNHIPAPLSGLLSHL